MKPALSSLRPLKVAVMILFASPVTAQTDTDRTNDEAGLVLFEKRIRPVLVEHCYECHSAESEEIEGGLLLDTRDGIRRGGDSGDGVVPGNANLGLVLKALRWEDDNLQMPPEHKLDDKVITDFERWVSEGASDPRESNGQSMRSTVDLESGRQFWAYQSPVKTEPPAVRDAAWPRSSIDRFVLAGLEAKGMRPSEDAEPRAWIRRAYFDLSGLPPSPEVVSQFLANPSQQAREDLVDRLLGEPQYGERWGRYWLDVARYAESSGSVVNYNYPNAWRYRDYVIEAFNADKPYDRFVREQIAGDLLPWADEYEQARNRIATGFLAFGVKTLNERNVLQFQMDMIDDQIDVTTTAFLGQTVACARCHDHKFDPIASRDYYALAGIFQSTETFYGTLKMLQSLRPAPLYVLPNDFGPPPEAISINAQRDQGLLDAFKEKTKGSKSGVIRLIISGGEDHLALYDENGRPKQMRAMGVAEAEQAVDSPLYVRGEIEKPADSVPRGVVQVLCTVPPPSIKSGSGRRELADWIATADNPLTSRVIVNRVWAKLFGRGIVASVDNFGSTGDMPTHPRLLDFLAVSFTEQGWSIKQLVRELVLSRAYGQASRFNVDHFEIDPDNTLLWRMSPRQLDAEANRDAILSVSGQLDLTPGVGSEIARTGDGKNDGDPGRRYEVGNQRSVYLTIVRGELPESLALFDFPEPTVVNGQRSSSNVPTQALYLMNAEFVAEAASEFGQRVMQFSQPADRIYSAYELAYARPPTQSEMRDAKDFVEGFAEKLREKSSEWQESLVWSAFCQSLLASSEFRILE